MIINKSLIWFWIIFFVDLFLMTALMVFIGLKDFCFFVLYYLIGLVFGSIIIMYLINDWKGYLNVCKISFYRNNINLKKSFILLMIIVLGLIMTKWLNSIITGFITGILVVYYLLIHWKELMYNIFIYQEIFENNIRKKYSKWLK